MPLNTARTRLLLDDFDFTALFIEELGWDHHSMTLHITVDGYEWVLGAIAQKRGMIAFHCAVSANVSFPDQNLRRKIERQVAKSARENFIVFTDDAQSSQVWFWVKTEPGRPAAARSHEYRKGQSNEALVQKLDAIAFTLEQEESLSLPHVVGRARAAFDVERVTKRFYDLFKKHHGEFLGFIDGITEGTDREWYASVMLNRLMFIYFVQKKGFLDNDRDYLRNRLSQV